MSGLGFQHAAADLERSSPTHFQSMMHRCVNMQKTYSLGNMKQYEPVQLISKEIKMQINIPLKKNNCTCTDCSILLVMAMVYYEYLESVGDYFCCCELCK